LAFSEGTVILALMPGSLAILALGSLAAKGDLNILALYLLVVLGAIVGDNVGYFLGGIYGRKIIKSGFVDPLQYRLAEDYVKKHGGKSIVFSRLVNGIKELAPFVAGSMKMEKKKFMIFNFLGALGWALLWLGAGYIFFQNLEMVEENISKILKAIGLLFVAGIG
jgi:undecaprenyl-diphosphatase